MSFRKYGGLNRYAQCNYQTSEHLISRNYSNTEYIGNNGTTLVFVSTIVVPELDVCGNCIVNGNLNVISDISCNELYSNSVYCDTLTCTNFICNSDISCNAVACNAVACNSVVCNDVSSNSVSCNTVVCNSVDCNDVSSNSVVCTTLYNQSLLVPQYTSISNTMLSNVGGYSLVNNATLDTTDSNYYKIVYNSVVQTGIYLMSVSFVYEMVNTNWNSTYVNIDCYVNNTFLYTIGSINAQGQNVLPYANTFLLPITYDTTGQTQNNVYLQMSNQYLKNNNPPLTNCCMYLVRIA